MDQVKKFSLYQHGFCVLSSYWSTTIQVEFCPSFCHFKSGGQEAEID